jgi:4'-phosphopantetheinyl transferase EntD
MDDDTGAEPTIDGAVDRIGSVDVGAIATALRAIVDDDLACGARAVLRDPIHPGERCLYVGVVDSVRRATATGRMLAREVLHSMGVSPGPILRTTGGRADWPAGIAGSIAHDDAVAVCVCGAGVNITIGVDVEPAEPLPAEIVADIVITDLERALVGDDLVLARLLFCAKEAVYKACFPLDKVFLEFKDVWFLEPATSTSTTWLMATSTGRQVRVQVRRAPRLLAVARVVSSPVPMAP